MCTGHKVSGWWFGILTSTNHVGVGFGARVEGVGVGFSPMFNPTSHVHCTSRCVQLECALDAFNMQQCSPACLAVNPAAVDCFTKLSASVPGGGGIEKTYRTCAQVTKQVGAGLASSHPQ